MLSPYFKLTNYNRSWVQTVQSKIAVDYRDFNPELLPASVRPLISSTSYVSDSVKEILSFLHPVLEQKTGLHFTRIIPGGAVGTDLMHKYMLELFSSVSNDLLFDHGLLCDLFLELSNLVLISSLNFFLLVPGHEVAAHPRHAAVPPEHDGAGDAAARPGAAAGPAAAAEREPLVHS